MARYLKLDIQDMIKIIRLKKLKPVPLIRLWALAAKSSDLSLELGQFKGHVEDFIKSYAPKLWGKTASSEKLITYFRKSAGIQ